MATIPVHNRGAAPQAALTSPFDQHERWAVVDDTLPGAVTTEEKALARSKLVCERCKARPGHVFHRRCDDFAWYMSCQSGGIGAANLVWVCEQCKGEILADPSGAELAGWTVQAGQRPDHIPVMREGVAFYLTGAGQSRTIPAASGLNADVIRYLDVLEGRQAGLW